jgi:hypothetical protein
MGNMRPPVIEDNERLYLPAIRKRWFCHFFEQLPARIRSEKKTQTQVELLKYLVNGYQESKELSFYIEEGKDTSDDKNVFTYGKDLKAFERQMFGTEGVSRHERAMDKGINPAGNPALQREIIMKEVRRRCIPDPMSLPKGEKASIGRYLENKYNISKTVFEDRYRELATEGLLGSEHYTIKS